MNERETMAINIVFENQPSDQPPSFIEVETDEGISISTGVCIWTQRKDGLWALRISGLPYKVGS